MYRLLLIVLFWFVMCQDPLHAEQMDDGNCATIGKYLSSEHPGIYIPPEKSLINKVKEIFKKLDNDNIKNDGRSHLDEITDDQFDAMAGSVFVSCEWAPYGTIGDRVSDIYFMMFDPIWSSTKDKR